MSNKRKTGGIITKSVLGVLAGFILLVAILPPLNGCRRAHADKDLISIGMSVSDVFQALDEWEICHGNSFDTASNELASFSAVKMRYEHQYSVHADKGTEKGFDVRVEQDSDQQMIDSKQDLVRFAEKQIGNGRPWNLEFTYMGGVIRSVFRIDLDSQGTVNNVSDAIAAQ